MLFLLPPSCVGCRKLGELLCGTCSRKIISSVPHCPQCRKSQNALIPCHCGAPNPPLSTLYIYDETMRKIIHHLKYRRTTGLVFELVSRLTPDAIAKCVVYPQLIRPTFIPIPLTPAKQKERGFNQSQLLARALGELLGIPVDTQALTRIKNTTPQAQIADRKKRLHNTQGIFSSEKKIPGSLILIDDVVTTGGTLTAASRALRRAGNTNVYALCLAQEV